MNQATPSDSRPSLLDFVLEDLRGNLGAPSNQHVLLYGPCARRLRERLTQSVFDDRELAARVLLVGPTDDRVADIRDIKGFWRATLHQLADACREHRPDVAAELDTPPARLALRAGEPEWEVVAKLRIVVDRALRDLGRHMVLVVPDLRAVTEAWDPDCEWRLRAVLQEADSGITLVGIAPQPWAAVRDPKRAWYGLFHELDLHAARTEADNR